ncbi:MAG: site-specific DNA-methyltransferase [Acidobacteria bacterium]|nr:site-specific DNA-methyltransferase [Acidobacteriota bacterium]
MTEALVTPASPSFEKLKLKLRELFELDKADLDFGIYRILRQRHAEITEFLDKHLETTVREALQSHGATQHSQVEDELRQAEAAAKAAGFNPDDSPKVKELREKLRTGTSLDAVADEVYSHLLTFFSRYYQEGDFLGLHRSTVHGRERYMIPYNGEEVKLVWANMDQYYIKSSELLRDYTFRITPQGLPGVADTESVIHFKLVEGDTEKDNRKPDGKTQRAFALDADKPFEEIDTDTLNIRFRYREHAAERDLQKKLNTDTEKTLADDLPPRWRSLLLADDPTYKGKDARDTRTILQKHLRGYTARHQFDYFIHKDLGGFLRRELDFYVKNEVMHLDDIEEMAAPKAEEYLSKIRALRRCALPVIGMLEQLENFQKRLWLKKKFVVETRYCLTLDRVPESLYPEICASDAQWQEWEQLYTISAIEPDLFNPQSAIRNPQFLKANPHLMIDTRHFSREFTLKLLSSIENLDESLDGVCFHSENFQALQLMQERYREQVKCVYIDPPYNTGNDGFLYKDSYRHSSWLTTIQDRISAGQRLLAINGLSFTNIDDNEQSALKLLQDQTFGNVNFAGQIIRPTGTPTAQGTDGLSNEFDYITVYSAFPSAVFNGLDFTTEDAEIYNLSDERGTYLIRTLRKTGGEDRREDRPSMFFEVEAPDGTKVLPYGPGNYESRWRLGPERYRELEAEGLIEWRKNDSDWRPYIKFYLEGRLKRPSNLWDDVEGNKKAQREIKNLFQSKAFSTPKPTALLDRVARIATQKGDLILDYFAGSGTTGHAVINLNREGGGHRKYILIEVGEYFDNVLVPRLKKVAYSTDWRDGKPQSRTTGISHAFKILRLESYEDTLNNLRLARTPEQEAALRKATDDQCGQYLLGYFLDVESAGSASLLDVTNFRDPFNYRLHIATASAGETKETAIDLVETFNWLIGLKVKHVDAQKGFVTVTGEKRAGGRTLIVWRTLGDDASADNEALEKYLAKLEINPADTEYDFIYVNGSHTLSDPHNKIHLIEEEFQRRMFESESFESLG